jgi:hypothetical protein
MELSGSGYGQAAGACLRIMNLRVLQNAGNLLVSLSPEPQPYDGLPNARFIRRFVSFSLTTELSPPPHILSLFSTTLFIYPLCIYFFLLFV